ncbi:MAG: glycogen synthase GlgA [Candidatus Omnitrophica bacterium]|nr:glycogen synthase GlgA [Candidatus Omnitrophota bacterium]
MKNLKILLLSSEVTPFAKTGGLADVTGILPIELKSLGCNVAVFLPYYRQTKVKGKDFEIRLVKKDLKTRVGNVDIYFSLYQCKREKCDFFFIDRPEFFDRDFLYGTSVQDYPDNAHRFAFFAKSVLTSIAAIGFRPDVIHCNDWQTALTPFYLKYAGENTELFKNSGTLFTIHNLAYQGLFEKEIMPEIGIGYEFFTPESLEFYGRGSFIKAGILYSDAISTVSKGYAREILTKEFGCGLEGLLNLRKDALYGILNGVDYSDWNPKLDKFIKTRYDITTLDKKLMCKKDLLSQMKLKASLDAPLLGIISRLAEQKGIDIVCAAMAQIIKLGANVVILGTGDEKYHKLLRELARKYPKNIGIKITFDNALAHKIEAGSDMFLMPSRYEPCGLNQMYSLRYGTIPVVRAVGGLDDTIIDYSQDPVSGNGFKFNQANTDDFINALKRAISVYSNKKEWIKLLKRAMGFDFSWEKSAKEYIRLYTQIAKRH